MSERLMFCSYIRFPSPMREYEKVLKSILLLEKLQSEGAAPWNAWFTQEARTKKTRK